MKPALTKEEWASFPNWPGARAGEVHELPLYYPTKHGIAAANLYGQPFGFTHEDVRRHREQAKDARQVYIAWTDRFQRWKPQEGEEEACQATNDLVAWHESMADRLAALLPEEEV